MCTDLACVWFFKQCSAYCYCVEVEVVVSGDKKIHSHHSAVVGGWRKFSHSVYELTKIIKDTCTSPEIITPYNLIRVCRANAPEKICNNRNKQVIVAEVSTAVHYHRSSPALLHLPQTISVMVWFSNVLIFVQHFDVYCVNLVYKSGLKFTVFEHRPLLSFASSTGLPWLQLASLCPHPCVHSSTHTHTHTCCHKDRSLYWLGWPVSALGMGSNGQRRPPSSLRARVCVCCDWGSVASLITVVCSADGPSFVCIR